MRKPHVTGKRPQIVKAVLGGSTLKEAAAKFGVTYDTARKAWTEYRNSGGREVPQVRRNYSAFSDRS